MNVLIAGQPQSGSTLVFNLSRMIIEQGADIGSVGLYDKSRGWPARGRNFVNILKIHDFDQEASQNADVVITTVRDIRDCVVSHTRRMEKDGRGAGPWTPYYYGAWNLQCYKGWHERSDFEARYEAVVDRPVLTVMELARALGRRLDESAALAIADAAQGLWSQGLPEADDPTNPKYQRTLLSLSHNTSGGRVGTHKDSDVHVDWGGFDFVFEPFLTECGYECHPVKRDLQNHWEVYASAIVHLLYGDLDLARSDMEEVFRQYYDQNAPFSHFVKADRLIADAIGRAPIIPKFLSLLTA
ncbi:hypothetical protein [Maricaulis sp.]|uniref:hypothetical protein n=1 Tax=Maricaulis sp. TaxID=1486257 RepID=UPI003A90DA87